MSALARHLEDYLRLRRMLGHKLDDAARQLPWFVDALDAADHEYVTVTAALAWALDRDWPLGSTVPGHRMTAVRGFARYLAGIDPRTEVPPPGLASIPRTWQPPFIYTDDDVLALMEAAKRSIREPLRAATYETLIGLLAVTGLRIGEALRLDGDDVAAGDAILVVRRSKFGKSRQVPVQPSALEALERYRTVAVGSARIPRPTASLCRCAARGSSTSASGQPSAGSASRHGSARARPSRRPCTTSGTPLPFARCWIGIAPASTSRPGWRGCRPISATASRATPHYLSAAPELLAHAARLVDDARVVWP